MIPFLHDAWHGLATGWDEFARVVEIWRPPSDTPPWSAPVIAAGALLALAILCGVSLLALGVLLTALLAAYLILDRVLGVSVAVRLP